MVRIYVLVTVCLYREGLVEAFARHRTVDVVGTAADSAEAVCAVPELRPDVVLMDVGLPDGSAVVRKIRATSPGARIVALAVPETGPDLLSWIEAGISGYVTPDGTVGDLIAVIERAARGEVACSPSVAARLFDRLADLAVNGPCSAADDVPQLTTREAEIARLVGRGLSNKEIARALSIALPTVKNHVHNVLRKFQVESRTDIAGTVCRPRRQPRT
jgi:DNA-binding NarL/FixJ family response regulator